MQSERGKARGTHTETGREDPRGGLQAETHTEREGSQRTAQSTREAEMDRQTQRPAERPREETRGRGHWGRGLPGSGASSKAFQKDLDADKKWARAGWLGRTSEAVNRLVWWGWCWEKGGKGAG